ncbi:MAG TPA: hypothetical protein VMA34_19870, partial [Terracidiphilus sp.]|nr:hypothetical protein [Terracidiphilus sp.]
RNKIASATKQEMNSTDSHPSDKNKDVRWMGHSFIPRGSATTVEDCYKTLTVELFAACKAGAFQTGVGLSGYPAPLSISATNKLSRSAVYIGNK